MARAPGLTDEEPHHAFSPLHRDKGKGKAAAEQTWPNGNPQKQQELNPLYRLTQQLQAAGRSEADGTAAADDEDEGDPLASISVRSELPHRSFSSMLHYHRPHTNGTASPQTTTNGKPNGLAACNSPPRSSLVALLEEERTYARQKKMFPGHRTTTETYDLHDLVSDEAHVDNSESMGDVDVLQ